MRSGSLLPRGEKTKMGKRYRKIHCQLSVPLLMQSHFWRDILSVQNSKRREKKRNKFRIIGKRFLSTEEKRICPHREEGQDASPERRAELGRGGRRRWGDRTGQFVPCSGPGLGARARAAGLEQRAGQAHLPSAVHSMNNLPCCSLMPAGESRGWCGSLGWAA